MNGPVLYWLAPLLTVFPNKMRKVLILYVQLLYLRYPVLWAGAFVSLPQQMPHTQGFKHRNVSSDRFGGQKSELSADWAEPPETAAQSQSRGESSGGPLLPLPASGGRRAMAHGCITSVSASVFTRPLLLCVSLLRSPDSGLTRLIEHDLISRCPSRSSQSLSPDELTFTRSGQTHPLAASIQQELTVQRSFYWVLQQVSLKAGTPICTSQGDGEADEQESGLTEEGARLSSIFQSGQARLMDGPVPGHERCRHRGSRPSAQAGGERAARHFPLRK